MVLAREPPVMPSEGTQRTSVKTYVPEYQKQDWQAHAEELGMTQSEFVRTMVQAGRRGFGAETELTDPDAEVGTPPSDAKHEEPASSDVTPGVSPLETVLLQALRERPREFDELVEVVAEDLRSEINDVLGDLRDEGTVEHEPLDGGFRVVDDG